MNVAFLLPLFWLCQVKPCHADLPSHLASMWASAWRRFSTPESEQIGSVQTSAYLRVVLSHAQNEPSPSLNVPSFPRTNTCWETREKHIFKSRLDLCVLKSSFPSPSRHSSYQLYFTFFRLPAVRELLLLLMKTQHFLMRCFITKAFKSQNNSWLLCEEDRGNEMF